MYAVRPATKDDLVGIMAIDRAVAGHTHAEDILGPAIDAGRVLLAAADGRVLAYLRWEYFWDTIPLCLTVRVMSEHRRRGIGRALYHLAENGFRKSGAKFWLSSTEENNERSMLFHEALGFRPIGTLRELGQEVGEIFLRKDLARTGTPVLHPPTSGSQSPK
jgi:ribosomal protein S18 acetylase RimI-like enzyme